MKMKLRTLAHGLYFIYIKECGTSITVPCNGTSVYTKLHLVFIMQFNQTRRWVYRFSRTYKYTFPSNSQNIILILSVARQLQIILRGFYFSNKWRNFIFSTFVKYCCLWSHMEHPLQVHNSNNKGRGKRNLFFINNLQVLYSFSDSLLHFLI